MTDKIKGGGAKMGYRQFQNLMKGLTQAQFFDLQKAYYDAVLEREGLGLIERGSEVPRQEFAFSNNLKFQREYVDLGVLPALCELKRFNFKKRNDSIHKELVERNRFILQRWNEDASLSEITTDVRLRFPATAMGRTGVHKVILNAFKLMEGGR